MYTVFSVLIILAVGFLGWLLLKAMESEFRCPHCRGRYIEPLIWYCKQCGTFLDRENREIQGTFEYRGGVDGELDEKSEREND